MSSSLFKVTEHAVPCAHIRHYPFATIDGKDHELHLSVKQYTPLDNLNPQPGDVTFLGAHANGFPKELYEPLWDSLLEHSKKAGFRIRNIFISDVAHQGQSSVLNEQLLGNDPSWWDAPRDLFNLVNHFRNDFVRPIVGIGHSMGGNNLINLSLMHPRLFTTLLMIDPVVSRVFSPRGNWSPAQLSSIRRDRWPSRKIAAEGFKKSKFYSTWDPRVLDLWVKYGLRDLPTKVYDEAPESRPYEPAEKEVTLTTTKHQEVFTFLRPTPKTSILTELGLPEHLTHSDLNPAWKDQLIYRPEGVKTFANLPFLAPSVFYVFGEHSDLCTPEAMKDKLETTGTGLAGSGGVAAGRVRHVLLKDTGHLIPMEKTDETAKACAGWLESEIKRWKDEEKMQQDAWAKVPERDKFTINKKMYDALGMDLGAGARKGGKGNSKL
jgi:pimeloyl-ACP methyl ester carboxylesterase